MFTGQQGPITPEFTAIEAGPWVDCSARYGPTEALSGVAIFCHPTLPVFPPPWILRPPTEKSMQNPVYPGRQPVPVSTTEPTILRYALVIHRNGADIAKLNQLHAAYAQAGPEPQ